MRFKKLRMNVGVAIVIFILIVGYIMVFGLLSAPVKNQNKVSLPTPTYANPTTQNSDQNTQPAVQQPQPVQQNPTLIFQTFRTRAS